MPWDFNGAEPIYLQIIEHIRLAAAVGEYKAGDKLPSVRELAAEAEVNPNTMQKALSELERQGLLTTRRTAGRFITEDETLIAGLREQLARECVEKFFNDMEKLGYSREEVSQILERGNENADDMQ